MSGLAMAILMVRSQPLRERPRRFRVSQMALSHRHDGEQNEFCIFGYLDILFRPADTVSNYGATPTDIVTGRVNTNESISQHGNSRLSG